MTARITLTLLALLLSGGCATTRPGVEPLLRTTTSWDGGDFSYPDGQAELVALRITLQDGESNDPHCHPVPTFGYVISGQLEVTTRSGEVTVFRPGSAAVEVMNTVHQGKAINGPVELLVFYASAAGMETTYPADSGQCAE